jgi:hypothetical protein
MREFWRGHSHARCYFYGGYASIAASHKSLGVWLRVRADVRRDTTGGRSNGGF